MESLYLSPIINFDLIISLIKLNLLMTKDNIKINYNI